MRGATSLAFTYDDDCCRRFVAVSNEKRRSRQLRLSKLQLDSCSPRSEPLVLDYRYRGLCPESWCWLPRYHHDVASKPGSSPINQIAKPSELKRNDSETLSGLVQLVSRSGQSGVTHCSQNRDGAAEQQRKLKRTSAVDQ